MLVEVDNQPDWRAPERCTYCSEIRPLIRSHVFFITMDPEMLTVPACIPCQRIMERGVNDLRTFVNRDPHGRNHPDAPAQRERMERAARRRRPPIVDAAHDPGCNAALITGADSDHSAEGSEPIDDAAMRATLGCIVRGLYRHETGSVLPPDLPVTTAYIPPHRLSVVQVYCDFMRYECTGHKGNRVARWSYYLTYLDDRQSTFWMLSFNASVYIMGGTGRGAGIVASAEIEPLPR